MREAWIAVPPASRTLDAIALARLELSRVTGAPPQPRARSTMATGWPATVHDVAGAAFCTDGRPWRLDDFEESWQGWLRLSVGSPARLFSLEESAEAGRSAA